MGNGKFAIVARPSFETQLIRTPNALLSPPSRATWKVCYNATATELVNRSSARNEQVYLISKQMILIAGHAPTPPARPLGHKINERESQIIWP